MKLTKTTTIWFRAKKLCIIFLNKNFIVFICTRTHKSYSFFWSYENQMKLFLMIMIISARMEKKGEHTHTDSLFEKNWKIVPSSQWVISSKPALNYIFFFWFSFLQWIIKVAWSPHTKTHTSKHEIKQASRKKELKSQTQFSDGHYVIVSTEKQDALWHSVVSHQFLMMMMMMIEKRE